MKRLNISILYTLLLAPSLCAAQTAAMAPQLLSDPATLIQTDDYPPAALSAGASGAVRAVLEIDDQGRVSRCTFPETSPVIVLDIATCDTSPRYGIHVTGYRVPSLRA